MLEFRGNHSEEILEKNRTMENRTERKNGKKKSRVVRKIGVLTLSAMLFGTVAAGTFYGVNSIVGDNGKKVSSQGNQNTSHLLNVNTITTENGERATGPLDVSSIAEAAMPSIVSITNKSVQEVQNYFQTFGYSFQQPQTEETESCGSGIIIGKNDTELLIVTNNHVVEGADMLSVSFIDNQVYEANIKGTDAANDLAVIAVPLSNISEDTMTKISVAAVGNSQDLKVGEQVVAIGNALGYGQSVTTGIVSATDRVIRTTAQGGDTDTDSNTYIQTDAAINPGNSGGALLNMNGELIGINSAKLASTEVEGMGYAIPISRVSDIIEGLMNETTRTKLPENDQGVLDIKCQDVTKQMAQAYGVPQGVYVAEVSEFGAAYKAGLTGGMIITSLNGKEVSNTAQLKELLSYYAVGESVDLTVYKPDTNNGTYTQTTVSVTLGGNASSGQMA